MPHVEGQQLARSETASPLVSAMPFIQQDVTPLRLDIPDDWALPTFYNNDGLFGDIEQPMMSATFGVGTASWQYSLPFPGLSETIDGSTTISLSPDSLETFSCEAQHDVAAIPDFDVDELNENLQHNILLQQPFVPTPSESDYFANAWEQTEYAMMNGTPDLSDLNRDPFYQ